MKRLDSLKRHIEKIGFLQTISYLLQRLILKNGSLIKIKVPGLLHPVFLRNKSYDTHIFTQVFIREEVKFEFDTVPESIVDCGANIGLATLFFKRQYPKAKIISIEPEFSNYNMLVRNTKEYKSINRLHAAVWYKNAMLKIIDTGEGVASFITKEEGNVPNFIEEINAISIVEVMAEFGLACVGLVKIDIEGSEYEIFNCNADEWIDRANMLAVEIHENLRPGVTSLIYSKLDNKFTKQRVGEYSVFKKAL